ncbi:MAG: ABC transporter ATP-binding protein [Pseudomonadota bacterium]
MLYSTHISFSTLKPARTITSERRHSLLRLIRERFTPHWGWFAGGTALAVVTSAAVSSYGVLIKLVLDSLEALSETAETGVAAVPGETWMLLGLIGAMVVVRALSLYGMTILNNTGVQRAIVDVQTDQFESLTMGDFERLSGDASGGFVSRFINDVNALRDAGLRLANNLTKGVLTVIGAIAAMLWIDWQLTLMLVAAYPIAFAPVIALGNRVRKRAKHAQTQVGEVTSLLSEGFQSARIVKAFGLENYQQERARKGFRERARLFLKVLTDKAAVDPILEIAGGTAIVLVLAITAWRIASGGSSIPDFVAIVALIGIAAPELRALGTLNAVAQEGGAAADRVFDILDAEPRIADAADAGTLTDVRGAIAFEDVHFHYPDGTEALSGLNFQVDAGERIAIVGPSGAGKSTVFNLLLRLYDPSTGIVRVDGRDVRSVTGASLRAVTGLVAQDAALFDDTVRANIALGRIGASEDEIIAAARAASAHDFILELPGGYDAPAGEMGRNLSGGQRQRIALARAILRGAPILLLDEATSALDASSEAKVQAALAEFSEGRTTLIIAHRLSTVRAADRILVMENGQVVEEGSHDQLMAANGAYARLVELQLS